MTTRLSVNVNKVATLRNSRGGREPDLWTAVKTIVEAGAPSITVHPRADERHIRRDDVPLLSELLRKNYPHVEYNIEGDPHPAWIELVQKVKPSQCTLVPVVPGEITSQAGWPPSTPKQELTTLVRKLKDFGIRVSVFVDPNHDAISWAADLGADRVELYTEPYARACERNEAAQSLAIYQAATEYARSKRLGINAGHDLDLSNTADFVRVCKPDEVSIGHALISRALYVGLAKAVQEFLALTES